MKRAICLLILLSMVLHCASRLGVLSYLYNKRHNIAYSIGLITQVPISMCNGDYFSKQAPLTIADAADHDKQMPPAHFPTANEIILFVESSNKPFSSRVNEHPLKHNTISLEVAYAPPILTIFHPPA
ncbi:hypothetical protein [Chryseosolibacter indicus]|uniref:Uncharacterized protein n=1 Tax=Chryseosolibacter indicus TaxID=2782351 RepID=A0ABS5VUB1_9BACT|nr:hypothetical protein [Chryseosolibacter indicus]MBT1704420.1 hypothetical protein [Chryseosolibacter indicus]